MEKDITALIIMDGYGLSDKKEGNAVFGNSPYVDALQKKYPTTKLLCSGLSVGLPEGQMGNSEVGHLNMGAGRIVFQELPRISRAISDGSFFRNQALTDLAQYVKQQKTKLHLIGLLSDGGVHSSMEHLFACLDFFKAQGLSEAYVHCFLDGRDVGATSALTYLDRLQNYLTETNFGKIASLCGRYYAMDRDNRWERVEKAYNLLALGIGKNAVSYKKAIEESYDEGITDEFVLPTVVVQDGLPTATICDNDGVVFFNFRSDRPRELTKAFCEDDFDGFDLSGKKRKVKWVCLTEYDKSFKNVEVAFKPNKPKNTLGQYLSYMGKKQLRIAETEKYAHVTFFFNGGVETPDIGEDRVLIPSPKVATYDLKPEMSAPTVAEKAVELLATKKYDLMVLNFANCDMVGHTGNFDATCKAVRVVDNCVCKVVEFILSCGGTVFLTADHGNAEKMLNDDGSVHPAHTTNDVPFVMIKDGFVGKLADGGKLCDIAPTILHSMGLLQPIEMTGRSLIVCDES